MTGKVLSAIWRGLKFTGRVAVEGLAHIGFAYTVMPPGYFAAIRAGKQAQKAAEWDDEGLPQTPPPGQIVYINHPERMVDLPMTSAEQLLWSQLMDPGPKEKKRYAD